MLWAGSKTDNSMKRITTVLSAVVIFLHVRVVWNLKIGIYFCRKMVYDVQ